jgi:hypothetical protein
MKMNEQPANVEVHNGTIQAYRGALESLKASSADSLHFDGEPYTCQSGRLDPDPNQCDRSDPDPHQSEKQYPDPHHCDADPH